MIAVCDECGEMRPRHAKGMCQRCYRRIESAKRRAGGMAGSWADARYKRWLATDSKVPVEMVQPWIAAALAANPAEEGSLHTGLKAVADGFGVDERLLGRIMRGEQQTIKSHTADRLAIAAGRLVELCIDQPVPGKDGWSEVGRYCGDHGGDDNGCGTFHHSHYADGLCRECHDREYAGLDIEPRDIRVTRELREASHAFG